MSGKDRARKQLRRWIDKARPGDHVASVAGLQAVADGLARKSTVEVLSEAIRDGFIGSTRGPRGGYWKR